ncbi:MAG: hypothetical protein COA33_006840 [Fluviicola sp.]|nr:hypothetical protein [Fluviicola sp.]
MPSINNLKRIYFGVVFLFVIIQFDLIQALFRGGWDVNTLYFIIPLLLLLLGSFFFWKDYKVGILLLVVFSTYSGVTLFASGLMTLTSFVEVNDYVTHMILPSFSSVTQLIVGAGYLLLGWMLVREDVISRIGINKRLISSASVISTIIALNLTFS